MKNRTRARVRIRGQVDSKGQKRAGKQYETLLYEVHDKIATVTLNRPDRLNTIVPPMPDEIEDAIGCAVVNREVRVIVLRGAGRAFSAGFDFGGGFHHWEDLMNTDGKWDPGKDFIGAAAAFGLGSVPKFMSIWRSPKPVIAQIHGWCVGGGSDLALCADLVIASSDARIGTPYSRIWGCSLTGMWVYRLGLAKAKEFALTGKPLSGVEAARAGLINRAVPFRRLESEVRRAASELASIPPSQLAAMKLIVNQAYDNMGLASTQTLGPIIDGLMRNTPDALRFIEKANREGVPAAVAARDGLFHDYSQARRDERPNPRNIIRPQ
jgi:enoyl-CoA hydratase/carnithine racemase